MTARSTDAKPAALAPILRAAGATPKAAARGRTAICCRGHPDAFVLVTSGILAVDVRVRGGRAPWIGCRVGAGEDCLPLTAAILASRDVTLRATCLQPAHLLELAPERFMALLHEEPIFRQALFAAHGARAPAFFAQIAGESDLCFERRLAGWLLGHVVSGRVDATHAEIAADLLTAREVVSRKLRAFACKGWILQARGSIRLDAPAALSRLARGNAAWRGRKIAAEAPLPAGDGRMPALSERSPSG